MLVVLDEDRQSSTEGKERFAFSTAEIVTEGTWSRPQDACKSSEAGDNTDIRRSRRITKGETCEPNKVQVDSTGLVSLVQPSTRIPPTRSDTGGGVDPAQGLHAEAPTPD